MQVDWSKASEGAIGVFTRLGVGPDMPDRAVFVKTKRSSLFMNRPGFEGERADGGDYHVFSEHWNWSERPWPGEGLPPAGTVCEFFAQEKWHETTVIGVDSRGFCVFESPWAGGDTPYSGCCVSGYFRPIRTPEQIAAEEREKAIKEMVAALEVSENLSATAEHIVCCILYDAGYRLTAKP